MIEAKNGDTVKVHFVGMLEGGSVFVRSMGRQPLEFCVGKKSVPRSFEEAVIGLEPGDKSETTIEAENAYGMHSTDLVTEVPRERMPKDLQISVGQQLQVSMANGQTAIVMVTDVTDTAVTIDANHPLAGQDLTFAIELVEIV